MNENKTNEQMRLQQEENQMLETKDVLNFEENVVEEQQDFVLTKKEINRCRHKSEKRWFRFLCILNLIIVLSAVCIVAVYGKKELEEFKKFSSEVKGEFQKLLDDEKKNENSKNTDKKNEKEKNLKSKNTDEKNEKVKNLKSKNTDDDKEELSDEENEIFKACVEMLLVLIILPLVLNYYYQYHRATSIRITEKNFPEIYERVKLYAKRLGMKKVPEVYVTQENGILNAFSTFIVRKQYIEIYADIFEIAYREYKDLDAISFVLAHEMAHIQYKHATFGYQMKIMFANMIPIIGSTASRAREYSCDRLAQKITGNDGIEAMMSLMAGKHLYKMVDKEDYLEYAKGVKGFFVWVANLLADHPIMTKRIVALEKGEGSGKLY